ncbi:MAG: AraC family transcriptional regulator [Bacteroidota bacterium]
MNFQIDIERNIIDQFVEQLQTDRHGDTVRLPSNLGKGTIHYRSFPDRTELYHFKFKLSQPLSLRSFNPNTSDWLLLNINLSKAPVEKIVNRQEFNFQKYLPTGILFYTPNTEVYGASPAHEDFEIVLVRLHRSFFSAYLNGQVKALQNADNAIIYEDLDYLSEKELRAAINFTDNNIGTHASLLQFIALFLDKLNNRELGNHFEHLHPTDVKGLFMASAYLRNPLVKHIPSIADLAKIAGMGTTKFKTNFKQVFGKPPKQYHQKIKFEYARQELAYKRKTASELSYELGYSHPSKFTLAYKKQFGALPSSLSQ